MSATASHRPDGWNTISMMCFGPGIWNSVTREPSAVQTKTRVPTAAARCSPPGPRRGTGAAGTLRQTLAVGCATDLVHTDAMSPSDDLVQLAQLVKRLARGQAPVVERDGVSGRHDVLPLVGGGFPHGFRLAELPPGGGVPANDPGAVRGNAPDARLQCDCGVSTALRTAVARVYRATVSHRPSAAQMSSPSGLIQRSPIVYFSFGNRRRPASGLARSHTSTRPAVPPMTRKRLSLVNARACNDSFRP